MNKQYKAIVIGGTGGVGAYLVEKLLESSHYSKVTVISRRELQPSAKLHNIFWKDFSEKLKKISDETIDLFKDHDVFFCCLGAPEKALLGLMFNKKKYEPMFQTIDYDYVVGASSAAAKAGVPQFSVISSSGLSEEGTFPYIQIKWRMEQTIKKMGFKSLSIFHPSHLMKPAGDRESFCKKIILNFIASIAGIMPHPQKAITVESVADAMIWEHIDNNMEGINIYEADDMRELIKGSMK